jgi:hypothetical protein
MMWVSCANGAASLQFRAQGYSHAWLLSIITLLSKNITMSSGVAKSLRKSEEEGINPE